MVARRTVIDFSFWKFQVELVLEQHQLLRVIKGVEVCPQPEMQHSRPEVHSVLLQKVKEIGIDSTQVHGYGTVAVRSNVEGTSYKGSLQKVLYVPHLGVTLFSIGVTTDLGCTVTFDHNQIRIYQNSTPVCIGKRSHSVDLYYLNIEIVRPTARAMVSTVSINTWHQRFGHISDEVINCMESIKCVVGL